MNPDDIALLSELEAKTVQLEKLVAGLDLSNGLQQISSVGGGSLSAEEQRSLLERLKLVRDTLAEETAEKDKIARERDEWKARAQELQDLNERQQYRITHLVNSLDQYMKKG